ncbi:MAG TPA: glycosyltransferase [Actinomycetota bacterium]|nr:glycosyltransferase [Actinomycetota bacterium]
MIVATLGRPDRLLSLIAGVVACEPPPMEIVVVDGDASEASREALAMLATDRTPISYVTSPPGLTKQRMAGLDRARAELVLFLDDDVEIPGNTFAELAAAYADAGVVGVTGRVLEPSDRVVGKTSRLRRYLPGGGTEGGFTRYGYPRRVLGNQASDIRFMQGCFMSARLLPARETGFDTALPGYGLAEDEDFSYRLSTRGRIRYLPDLHIVHHNQGFSSRDQRAFNRTVVVNRAYLFRKNFSRTLLARLQFGGFIGLLLLHRVINREWQAVRGLLEGSMDAWRKQAP